MRDPLCTRAAVGELLGLAPGAEADEVERAFLAALERGVPWEEAAGARDQFLDTIACGYERLLGFEDPVLRRLTPSPLQQPECLAPANRARTAALWQAQFDRAFPSYPIAHALAVLWYWSVLYEEPLLLADLEKAAWQGRTVDVHTPRSDWGGARPAARNTASAGPGCALPDMLEALVVFWAALAGASSFWRGLPGLDSGQKLGLRDRITAELTEWLDRFPERASDCRPRGPSAPSGSRAHPESSKLLGESLDALRHVYAEAAGTFREELSMAREMDSAQITILGEPLACGRRLLKRLERLEEMRERALTELKSRPGSGALRRVCTLLSPYLPIVRLLDGGDAVAALQAVAELSTGEQEDPEVRDLRARALCVLGAKDLGRGQVQGAIRQWQGALQQVATREARLDLVAEIAAAALEQVERLTSKDADGAIALLEQVSGLTRSTTAQEKLARLLYRRGADAVDSVRKQAQKSGFRLTTGTVDRVEAGVRDLDRARKLGHSEAARDLPAAKRLLSEARTGILGLAGNGRNQLVDGLKALKRPDADRAESLLQEFLSGHKNGDVPEPVRRILGDAMMELAKLRLVEARRSLSSNRGLSSWLRLPGASTPVCRRSLECARRDLDTLIRLQPARDTEAAPLYALIDRVVAMLENPAGSRGLSPGSESKAGEPPPRTAVDDLYELNLLSLVRWIAATFLVGVVAVSAVLGGVRYLLLLLPLAFIVRGLVRTGDQPE